MNWDYRATKALILFVRTIAAASILSISFASAQEGATEEAASAESAVSDPTEDAVTDGTTDAGAVSTSASKPARAAFDEVHTKWVTLLTEMRDVRANFRYTAKDEELDSVREKFNELKANGDAMIPELISKAIAAFQESPNEDRELTRFLVKVAIDSNQRDEYELAWKVSSALIEAGCEDRGIHEQGGAAAFVMHEFEAAKKHLETAQELNALEDPEARKYIAVVDDYIDYWKEEQALREKEAAAGDLPRATLETTKGKIVIELFENEAPETVGNFVHLIKSGFYSDKSFHRVLPRFMAQGGCSKGDGSGGPGYDIYCECRKPEYRKHFTGSISMAHKGLNTGGSQFFLTFAPTSWLNERHTVFGRVVEGMDVLKALQRVDPGKKNLVAPDKIISAEVTNLRDKEYVPNKVPRG